jgi:pimeloyl-ACP methyl ester carboxylesterase
MLSKKSTTVRALHSAGGALWWKRVCGWLTSISVDLAARFAAWLYLRPPPRRKPRLREQLLLATGQHLEVPFQTTTLSVWRWGRGPVVLLAHGWGGSAGQLQAFVQPLLNAGFTVVVFDAPAHGISGGSWASLPRLAAAIAHVAETVGPVYAVIGHSLGAAAAALAISRGMPAQRLVEVAPPADALQWFGRHARALELDERVERLARHKVERRLGVGLELLNPESIGAAVHIPSLVIHDKLDRKVPWGEGARVTRALPDATMMTTLGLGHDRIVGEPAVIEATERFLRWNRPAAARSQAAAFGTLQLPSTAHSMDVSA